MKLFQYSQNGGTDTAETILARARALEHGLNFSGAIDLYLQLDASLVPNFKELDQVLNSSPGYVILVRGLIPDLNK